jgi:RimJ/RimL family protein N-acetyltransferase
VSQPRHFGELKHVEEETEMFAITERLLLRPGWVEDAPALTKAVAHETVVRNLALLPWPYSEADARWYLENVHGMGGPEFLVFERHGDRALVGAVGLHVDPEEPEGALEIGYWIAPSRWGMGYATEAAAAVLRAARDTLRLRQIKSAYFTDNPASGRVLAKLGFRPTGQIVPRESKGRGRAVPTVLMALDLAADEIRPDLAIRPPQMQMMLAA